jgi:hypothetical protein
MSNALVKRQPNFGDDDFDDGFSDSPSSERTMRSPYLRWTDQTHWTDRDGIAPPPIMLVTGTGESVRRWRTIDGKKQVEEITTKPLPDPEEMNRITPESEWERQLDGNMSAGWKHQVFIHLVNLATGERYTFSNHTAGAHIAWDSLRESVATMRALRGAKCFPVVKLDERPMKSKYRPGGMGMRPHFEIVDWKVPRGPKVVGEQPTPQLTGPAELASAANAAPPTPSSQPTQAPPATSAAVRASRPHPVPAPASKPPSAKTPVKVSDYTLAVMGEVKPVTTEELMNDSLDDLPWDADPQ